MAEQTESDQQLTDQDIGTFHDMDLCSRTIHFNEC